MNTPLSDSQALPSGTRIEEFVIERVLGSGGFGITYLATDTRLNRQVVIKENLPVQFCFRDTHSLTVAPRHTHGDDAENFRWSLENFSKEAAMLASLDHPGIVKVLRSLEAFGTAYLVMPFVEGVALDELVKDRDNKPFTEEEFLGLLQRVLSALDHLHQRGIYHRDIKPANILITNEDVPVLIDFGSARQRLSERSMTVIESAGYTPFEQLQSRGNVGPWSDLYALGATLVKVMTSDAPPKANDRIMGDPWSPLAQIPKWSARYSVAFLAGIDRALGLPIEERWQSAGEWMATLAGRTLPEAKTRTKELPAVATSRPTVRKWQMGVAVALALMIGGGMWWFKQSGREKTLNAQAVASGGLVIMSDPSAARVRNSKGEEVGLTPVEVCNLTAGRPWVGTLELGGYFPVGIAEDIAPGEVKRLPTVKLLPQPQKAIVTCAPNDTEVIEDGKMLGRTPYEGAPREVGSVIKFILHKKGYARSSVSGIIKLGESLCLHGKLEMLPVQVEVTSDPDGADVLADHAVVGRTPLKVNLRPEMDVRYTLRMSGFEAHLVSGKTEVGEPLKLHGVMVKSTLERQRIEPAELLKAAENGDGDAMWKVGICYDEGRGFPIDKSKALFWFSKCAESGNAEGMFLLGLSYEEQASGPEPEKAKYWFKRAADLEHEASMDHYKKIYLKSSE